MKTIDSNVSGKKKGLPTFTRNRNK